MYEDMYHGLFSRRLAEWAIGRMEIRDAATGTMKRIVERRLDDVEKVLETNKVELPEEFRYTAWYLFNMAAADYPRSLRTDEQRAWFVEETLCDPDGCPENVLDCFAVKMRNAGVPVYWEDMM